MGRPRIFPKIIILIHDNAEKKKMRLSNTTPSFFDNIDLWTTCFANATFISQHKSNNHNRSNQENGTVHRMVTSNLTIPLRSCRAICCAAAARHIINLTLHFLNSTVWVCWPCLLQHAVLSPSASLALLLFFVTINGSPAIEK